jgi:hypothetical protein
VKLAVGKEQEASLLEKEGGTRRRNTKGTILVSKTEMISETVTIATDIRRRLRDFLQCVEGPIPIRILRIVHPDEDTILAQGPALLLQDGTISSQRNAADPGQRAVLRVPQMKAAEVNTDAGSMEKTTRRGSIDIGVEATVANANIARIKRIKRYEVPCC